MKKLISLIAAISFASNVCYADCDFSKGITKNADGTYTYTQECNRKVGQTVLDNTTKAKQIDDLNKAIQLKDLTLTTADKRADDWMNTSMKLEENVQKMDTLKRDDFWIAFGLGVLTTFAAGMAAASLTNRH
jgi:hypothetical protein